MEQVKALPPSILSWLLWFGALILLYPIPGVVALRNVLLLGGVLGFVYSVWKNRPAFASSNKPSLQLWAAIAMFIGLSAWMLFHIKFVAWYPALSWAMWSGDWFVTWLTALFVFYLAKHLEQRHSGAIRLLLTAALWALMLHLFALLLYQAFLFTKVGVGALGLTPFAQRDYHSTLCVTALALIVAEIIARTKSHASSALMMSPRLLHFFLLITIVATLTLRTRNGSVIAFLLLGMAAIAWLLQRKHLVSPRKLLTLLVCSFVLIASFAWLLLKSDPRWENFITTAQISTDIHSNLHWLSPELGKGLPLLPDGTPVEESAYDRIAWATAALEQIAAHPLGLGYGHKAFGWAVNRAYEVNTGHESSHSGLLDFTLANGIPGTALWLLISICLLWAAWRVWKASALAAALMIMTHVMSYDLRILLDGHFSGFRLKLFAVLLGLLIAACLHQRLHSTSNANSPN